MTVDEHQKTILLVEDDFTNRKLVRVILGGRGYRIEEADSIRQAVESLRNGKPDLLLLDIRLGDGSGLDLIRSLRADPGFDHIPAIALTAQAMKDDESRFLAAGFDGYIAKPLDTRQLPEVIQRFLAEGRKSHAG